MNFIGVGAQKAGTSWIYACLYEHPEICAPVKEIHFFSRPRFERGQAWYEAHFRNCAEGTLHGEFSTSYLYSKETPGRIASMYPDAKLIAILRDPLERAYSQYRNAIKAGEIPKEMTFATFVRDEPSALAQGRYAEQLERYYAHFKNEQVLVLIYEDSLKDPAAFIRSIYEFLGVDPDFEPSMLHRTVNTARTPKRIWIDRVMHRTAEWLRKVGFDKFVFFIKRSGIPDTIRSANTEAREEGDEKPDLSKYADHFKGDVERLSELIGRDMNSEWGI